MKSTHWTPEQKQYVFDNICKLSIKEIALYINKSTRAVTLFLHRNRRDPRTVVKNNLLLKILEMKFKRPEYFSPNREFFNAVKIGQKRYWSIYKGIEIMKDEECQRIVDYLEVPRDIVFESRQIPLFTPPDFE